MASIRKPTIALILAGGTLDSVGRHRLDFVAYDETKVRVPHEEILSRLPELAAIANVRSVPFRRAPSSELNVTDWLQLLRNIEQLLADESVDGIVIGHGTSTMEETAYFLNLTVRTELPIVMTGAMRPASALGYDGELNLVNAIRLAASAEAHHLGVLVLMNDTILAARDVTKSTSYRVDAFRAPDAGALGYIDAAGQVVIRHEPRRLHAAVAFDVRMLEALPRVDVVLAYVSADGVMIDAAVSAGAQGIVVAGLGAGRSTPAAERALERARREGVIICRTTRTGSGSVPRTQASAKRCVVAGRDLQPWKARVLLSLALTQTRDSDAIQSMFDRF